MLAKGLWTLPPLSRSTHRTDSNVELSSPNAMTIEIRCQTGRRVLRFSNVRMTDDEFGLFDITLEAEGMRIEIPCTYSVPGHQYLLSLLQGMVVSWPAGWTGVQSWRSIDGELGLDFEWRKTGSIDMTVELTMELVWLKEVKMVIDYQHLSDVAQQMTRFV